MTVSFLSPPRRFLPVDGRLSTLRVDLNAHLLPGVNIDSISLEESVRIARFLVKAGTEKVIVTPTVMDGVYHNTPEQILIACSRFAAELRERRINLRIGVAARYFVSKDLVKHLRENAPLMTFGKSPQSFVLLETDLLEESSELPEVLELLTKRGYKAVLAHPERYVYLQENFDSAIELFRMGLLFQVDWRSFSVRHDARVRKLAEQLVDYRMVSFAGSNLYREDEIPSLRETVKDSYFQLMTEVGLINNELR
jgi:protein-tyrosine phosphatase